MSTHTPGPWDAIPDNGADSEGDWYVIAPAEDVVSSGLSEADARLIAAAPDLLALLSRAIEACRSSAGTEERENFIRDARAAIARIQQDKRT